MKQNKRFKHEYIQLQSLIFDKVTKITHWRKDDILNNGSGCSHVKY